MKRLLWIFLSVGLFFRIYRITELTGFYFDQGRDALVIWDLWHSGKLFLTGPTTGIEGIFLGPFYYYLIAPFYLWGGGNPVYPALALVLINILGIYIIFRISAKYFHPLTALLSAFFMSFSFQLTRDHRWLSNPTPLPLFSALAILLLLKLINGSKSGWTWFFLGLVLGLSLQLEAASAVFFLPAVVTTGIIFRKKVIWGGRGLVHLFFSFLLTLVPQLWFNFRHGNILFKAFQKFLITEKSFSPELSDFYQRRLVLYFESFFHKIFPDSLWAVLLFVFLMATAFLVRKKIFTSAFLVVAVWVFTPLIFLLFYHGNSGYVWSYYFTGAYPSFIIAVAWVLTLAWQTRIRFLRILSGLFMLVFTVTNLNEQYLFQTGKKPSDPAINLGTSLAAVDWVYEDAAGRPFNVDVYVPPVVPHAYDYLFLWRGTAKFKALPDTARTPLLYLVYEQDPPHPERLQAWLDRQAGIAVSQSMLKYGGVTVERRWRPN